MFFCAAQQAYLRTAECRRLRSHPIAKAPAGSQPRLKACENCMLSVEVDRLQVPTVTIHDYLQGVRPVTARGA
jgi:hypothetical protein